MAQGASRRWWGLSPRHSVRQRFVVAVGWTLLPVVVLAVVAVAALGSTLGAFGGAVGRGQSMLVPLLTLQGSVTAGAGVNVLLATTPDSVSRYQQKVTEVERQFDVSSHGLDPGVGSAVARAHEEFGVATAVISRWSALPAQQQQDTAIAARAEFSADIRQTREALGPAVARSQDLIRADLDHARGAVARDVWVLAFMGLVAVVVGVVVALGLGRSVLTPLRQLQVSLARVGGGDLHHRLVTDRVDEFGAVAGAVNMMSTQLQGQQEVLAHRVTHDHLTGLGNRVLLGEMVGAAAEHPGAPGATWALLFIDLDDFKTVNDSLGHTLGDTLLRAVAARLASSIRGDDTAFRLGGDEFAVLLADVADPAEAEKVAAHILGVFAEPFVVCGRQLRVSCSIGVALAHPVHPVVPGPRAGVRRGDPPPSLVSVESLLEAADLAMYAAKRAGKNQICLYAPPMLATVSERLTLKTELRTALACGQLRVRYQPVVDLATGAVRGAEALVRWQHPSRGLLGPDLFIPVVEQTGMMVELTSLVLQTALEQVAQWQRDGLWPDGARMAVNISPQHLQHPGLVELITDSLGHAGVAGHVLTAEITESALLEAGEGCSRSILTAIRGLGVQVAIDDFGTGYSNLSRMQDFPLDVLKIDRSFLSPLLAGKPAPLAAAVITLGATLNLAIVAEGVETAAQADWLLQHGCGYGQGFLYARALTASDFTHPLTHTTTPLPGH